MKTSKLIFTDTKAMSRQQWLDFRKPITHVINFIKEHNKGLDNNNWLDQPCEPYYLGLIEFFKSQAWEDFIFPCIGGSDIGTVVGANKWKSAVELFYEKVGLKPPYEEENSAMFWGKQLEAEIAEKWQYWDGSIEGMIANYNEEKIIRRCRRVNAYTQNIDCPWIFVSLDRVINKQITWEECGEEKIPKSQVSEGVLEAKTINGFYAKQWESGVPLEHIIQVQTQIGVTELPYGELAILVDGREMQVLPFEYNAEVWENLKLKALVFFEKVKKACAYYILSKVCNEIEKPKYLAAIDSLSPDPDGSVSLENYLKENYQDADYEIVRGEPMLLLAQQHEILRSKISILEERQRLCSNVLKNELKDANVMKFGDLDPGKITWKANKNGVRSFRLSIRVPEAEAAELQEITKSDHTEDKKIAEVKELPLT